MTTTYEVLDALADSFNPVLVVVTFAAPRFRQPRERRSTLAYTLSVIAAIGFVYLVRAIDERLGLWASVGLDFSTHSALAAVLAVSAGAFHRRWAVPLGVALVLYFSLVLVMRYHGPLDIVTSAGLTGSAAAFIQLGRERAAFRPIRREGSGTGSVGRGARTDRR